MLEEIKEIEDPSYPYQVTVSEVVYVVLFPEGEIGYRVKLPSGAVTAYPAKSGIPNEANSNADIAYAIANPSITVSVPIAVSPAQIRKALNAASLRSAVDTAVSYASQDVQDTWEYATVVQRKDPLVNSIAAALSLSDSDVDALFVSAASL